MGEVVELETRRARAMDRAVRRAATHPALRWTAGTEDIRAHRLADRRAARTACGREGPLLLAPPHAPACPLCYPPPDPEPEPGPAGM